MNQTITNPQGENLDYSFHASNNESSDLLIIGHGVTGNKDKALLWSLWLWLFHCRDQCSSFFFCR